MYNNQNMKKVISFFANKYKYNWDSIYEAIKSKEPIQKQEIDHFKMINNSISIIDEQYPNNFKEIYMPPLLFFYKGNKELLNKDINIISLWSKINMNTITNLSKNFIYAIKLDKQNINLINKLIKNNYQLILVANNYQKQWLDSIDFNKNIVFISEIPIGFNNNNLDKNQNVERLILGISNKSLILNKSILELKHLQPLFKLENRPFFVLNKNDYTKQEIENYNIKDFN